jgi:hypothetical protein
MKLIRNHQESRSIENHNIAPKHRRFKKWVDPNNYIYSTRSIPTSLFKLNNKPIQFLLFCKVSIKMDFFWLFIFCSQFGKKLQKIAVWPFLCGLASPKRARNLTMLWFSMLRLSWCFANNFLTQSGSNCQLFVSNWRNLSYKSVNWTQKVDNLNRTEWKSYLQSILV